jgi:DNA repair exonuclease SbcCD ATPase subunit
MSSSEEMIGLLLVTKMDSLKEELGRKIDNLEGKIGKLQKDVDHLRTEMDDLKKLKKEFDRLREDVEEIKKNMRRELRKLAEQNGYLLNQVAFFDAIGVMEDIIPTPNRVSRLDAAIFSTEEEKRSTGKY